MIISTITAKYLFTQALADCKIELERLAESTIIDGSPHPVGCDDFENSLNAVLGCDVRFTCTGGQCHLWIGKQPCIDINTPQWVLRVLRRK